jgi:hypothetical protein
MIRKFTYREYYANKNQMFLRFTDKEVMEHKGGFLPSQGSRRRVKGKRIIAWIFYDSF